MSSRSLGVLVAAMVTWDHDSCLVGKYDSLDAVAQVKLGKYPSHVRLDRRSGDDQLLGDLGVRETAGDQSEDLELARGELLEPRRRLGGARTRAHAGLDQSAGDRWGEQRVAL